jgi:hypothetical protein
MSINHTFNFNQADYLANTPSPGGICATLSAKWIQLIRDKVEDRFGELAKAIRQSALIQKIARENYDRQALSASLSGLLKYDTQNKREGDIKEGLWASFSQSGLKNFICDKRRTGVHFSFFWKVPNSSISQGHSIAFWRSGEETWHPSGHIYAFDPNSGEFRFDQSDFDSWFSNLQTDYKKMFKITDFNDYFYFRIIKDVTGPSIMGAPRPIGRR